MSHSVDPGSVPSDRQEAQREQADSDRANRPAGKQPAHAGVGHLGENILVFTIMFVLFLLGLWAISFSNGDNVWPFAVCIGLAFIAFFIPQGVIGRSDTGADLAAGNPKKAKKRSAAVDS